VRREGVPRLGEIDRPRRTPIRYERAHPGELVHVDVKKLGRIPDGGGWRMLGRENRPHKKRRLGFDYLHVAVDDHSRYAYIEVHPDERAGTCAGFIRRVAEHLQDLGVPTERVMTDRARNYVDSKEFQAALADIVAQHRPTRPYRPQTNGKAERFNRTALEEWAYVRPYRSNEARLLALHRWLKTYDRERPHTAIGGLPPISRLSTT
jgi:transposase InsO family protein